MGSAERKNPFYEYEAPRNYADLRKELSEFVTPIKADESVSPFGPPPQYWDIRQEVLDELRSSGTRSYGEVETQPVEQFTRERYGLPSEVGVVPGTSGSNEMLERIAIGLADNTRIRIIAPFFTDFLKSIKYARRSHQIQKVSEPLHKPLEQVLLDNMPKKGERVPSVVVATVPDIRGDFADLDVVSEFSERWSAVGAYVILDLSKIGFVHDTQSPSRLVANNPNLITIESWSKAYGLADDGFATLIASDEIAQWYKRQKRHFHERHRDYMMLFNRLAHPKIIIPHLEKTRQQVRRYKSVLTDALNERDVKTLPHDIRLPFLIVDGEDPNFARELDLPITPGSGYFETYNPDPSITNTPMTDRYGRVGLPVIDYSDPAKAEENIRTMAKRIAATIKILRETNVQESASRTSAI